MKLLAGRLIPESPPEDFWTPDVLIQVYDPWSCAWYDVASVYYVGGAFIINLRDVSPPIEIIDIASLEVRIKDANI